MLVERRVSATYKDLPGGQVLGPTFDYTHRLLDPALAGGARGRASPSSARAAAEAMPRVTDILAGEGLIEADGELPRGPCDRRHHPRAAGIPDGARHPPAGAGARRRRLPAGARLFDPARLRPQPSLRRRDPHRRGRGRARRAGAAASPCRSAASASPNARWSTSSRARPRRRRSSPAATAWSSASASARRWRWRWSTGRCAPANSARTSTAPAQDEEFVISHSDNVQATGFVEHLKLPHYVDFQAELDLVRRMRARSETARDSRRDPKEAAE